MAGELRILTTDDLSNVDAQFEGIIKSIDSLDKRLSEYVDDNTGSTDILNYITYEITTNDRGFKEATITGCDASIKGVYELPSSIEGASVKVIGANAFDECEGLLGLLIPSTVTTIRDSAFRHSGLRFFYMPDSVKTLGMAVFYYAPLHYIRFSNSITSIPDGFCGRSEELTEIIWPKSLTSIGNNAFTFLKLNTLYIPSGVTTLNTSAFWEGEFKNIYIPKSLKQLSGAFGYCNDVTDIYYEGTQSEFMAAFGGQSVTPAMANASRHYDVSYAAGEDKINIKIDSLSDKFKSEIGTLSSSALVRTVVDELPQESKNVNLNTIYMVPNNSDNKINIYDEYLFIKTPVIDALSYAEVPDVATNITEVYINDERITELPFTLSDGTELSDILIYSTEFSFSVDSDDMSHTFVLNNISGESDSTLKLVMPYGAQSDIFAHILGKSWQWSSESSNVFIQGQIDAIDSTTGSVTRGDIHAYTNLIVKELIGTSECSLNGFATKSEYNSLVNRVNDISSSALKRSVVDKLPDLYTSSHSTIYMVGPKADGSYDEYMVVDNNLHDEPDINVDSAHQIAFTAYDADDSEFAVSGSTYYTDYICADIDYIPYDNLNIKFKSIKDNSYFNLFYESTRATEPNYEIFRKLMDNNCVVYILPLSDQTEARVDILIGITSSTKFELIGSSSVDLSGYATLSDYNSLNTKVNTLTSSAITRKIVAELPTSDDADSQTIYMIKSDRLDTDDIYDEYLYVLKEIEFSQHEHIEVSEFNAIEGTVPVVKDYYSCTYAKFYNFESIDGIAVGKVTLLCYTSRNDTSPQYVEITFSDETLHDICTSAQFDTSDYCAFTYGEGYINVVLYGNRLQAELIGSTEVNLSNYVSKSEYDSTITQLNNIITELSARLTALEETAATIADYSDEIEDNQ